MEDIISEEKKNVELVSRSEKIQSQPRLYVASSISHPKVQLEAASQIKGLK